MLTAAGAALSDLGRDRRMRAAIDLAWNALADEVAAAADRAPEVESAVLPLRARISVRAGLGNLAAGLRPPATGHDNPHYFDDAACVRAAVLAVVHPGDPGRRRRAGRVRRPLHPGRRRGARRARDGRGGRRRARRRGGRAPAWTPRWTSSPRAPRSAATPLHAVRLARLRRRRPARPPGSAFALVPVLEHEIVDHVYSYGIAAAETVPVALALATAAGRADRRGGAGRRLPLPGRRLGPRPRRAR